MIATAPLTTNEAWHEMARGDLIAFVHGAAYSTEQELADYLASVQQAQEMKLQDCCSALIAQDRRRNDSITSA